MTQRDVAVMMPVNLRVGGVGLPSRVGEMLAGKTVLAHAVARAQQVAGVSRVVLVHEPADDADDIRGLLGDVDQTNVTCVSATCSDPSRRSRQASRKWALSAWRGGLGGATCYDELLFARALVEAADQLGIESLVLLGADWPMHDPKISSDVLAIHMQEPEQLKLTFSQAPPGLAGLAMTVTLLRELAESEGTIGLLLGYSPRCPQGDPIGKDVCAAIPHEVRNLPHRFVYDTNESVARMQAMMEHLNMTGPTDAMAVVAAVASIEAVEAGESFVSGEAEAVQSGAARANGGMRAMRAMPRHVTIELTPQRDVDGPITPQHYTAFDRGAMDVDLFKRVVGEIAEAESDVTVMLGGLGDALLHPDWQAMVQAAVDAGVFAIGIETDLRCDRQTIAALLDLPIDLLSVRLNADTEGTYEAVMGRDDFTAHVIANMEFLINERNRRSDIEPTRTGLPWLVPRLIKTEQTLADMEFFYDRWVHFLGHAMIDPATPGRCVTGRVGAVVSCGISAGNTDDRIDTASQAESGGECGGVMPALGPVSMAPPLRRGCRQLSQRMTIHSDGVVARCDQDWHGHAPAGDVKLQTVADVWQNMRALREAHQAGRFDELSICTGCEQWHRP